MVIVRESPVVVVVIVAEPVMSVFASNLIAPVPCGFNVRSALEPFVVISLDVNEVAVIPASKVLAPVIV